MGRGHTRQNDIIALLNSRRQNAIALAIQIRGGQNHVQADNFRPGPAQVLQRPGQIASRPRALMAVQRHGTGLVHQNQDNLPGRRNWPAPFDAQVVEKVVESFEKSQVVRKCHAGDNDGDRQR